MTITPTQKLTPCLWFDTQAEEAVHFYASVFKNVTIGSIIRYGEGAPMPAGTVLTIPFQVEGMEFLALNGGPLFTFTPAISFIVNCETQEEVDEFWEKLAEGGRHDQCGWLSDKYGVTWQIVPAVLSRLLQDSSASKSGAVMAALLQMKKIDIAALRKAYDEN